MPNPVVVDSQKQSNLEENKPPVGQEEESCICFGREFLLRPEIKKGAILTVLGFSVLEIVACIAEKDSIFGYLQNNQKTIYWTKAIPLIVPPIGLMIIGILALTILLRESRPIPVASQSLS